MTTPRSEPGLLIWQVFDSRRKLAANPEDSRAALRLARALQVLWDRFGLDLDDLDDRP